MIPEPTVNFSPTPMVTTPFEIVTFEGAFFTSIVQACSPPFEAFAVIHTLPVPTVFTLPFLSTVAILEFDVLYATVLFELVHVTLLFVAFEGLIVALIVWLFPLKSEIEILSSLTLCTSA